MTYTAADLYKNGLARFGMNFSDGLLGNDNATGVYAVLVGGIVAAAALIDSPAQLVGTGHGRILLAKVAVTVALVVVAGRNRSGWLAAAQRHRIRAEDSVRRSVVELILMTMVLTFAAALSVTG